MSNIILEGSFEWQLEQMRLDLVASLEKDGIDVPECLKKTLLTQINDEETDNETKNGNETDNSQIPETS